IRQGTRGRRGGCNQPGRRSRRLEPWTGRGVGWASACVPSRSEPLGRPDPPDETTTVNCGHSVEPALPGSGEAPKRDITPPFTPEPIDLPAGKVRAPPPHAVSRLPWANFKRRAYAR